MENNIEEFYLVQNSQNSKINWKEYCSSCKKNHIVTNKVCPSCGVYFTPQPVSEKVYDDCMKGYECDGCEAYRDRY
jgi:rRNA maturation endonuclease Nob1